MKWGARGRWVVALGLLFGATGARGADFSTGGTFLGLGHGARAQALGGAAIALTRDDAAAYWNPANLAWLEGRPGVTLMHATLLPGIDDGYDTASFGRGAGERLGLDDQSRRPTRWGYGLFASHLGFDFESGKSWSENALQLAGACALNNYTTLGMSLKLLRASNDFESANASGAGVDLGVTFLLSDRWTASVVGRDLWTRLAWDTDKKETLTPTLTGGLEARAGRRWSAEADFGLREGRLDRVMAGLEWRPYRDLLSLRGGWTTLRAGEVRGYPSAGAGLHYDRIDVDYAASFDDADAFDIGQRVSLRIGL
jgi:hypothetical protein